MKDGPDNCSWGQGSWNAYVVFDCATRAESRKRFRKVPDQFKEVAGNHAGTYWDIQDGKGYRPKARVKI